VKTATRFSSLAWGSLTTRSGAPNPAAPQGLVVGGMADGIVSVWDAGALLRGEGELAQLARVERHHAAVRSVQFNPHAATSHLLAAGSADGDVSVINLERPGEPSLASPLTGGAKLESEVTSVAWNSDVQHILATATNGGVVVVWDLKENREEARGRARERRQPARGLGGSSSALTRAPVFAPNSFTQAPGRRSRTRTSPRSATCVGTRPTASTS
jgi:protein transport protein SEC31